MTSYVGLDVSQQKTHISIVDAEGKETWHGKVTTSPLSISAALREHAPGARKIGFESGPLSTWLFHSMRDTGLPVICIDAKRDKAGLEMQKINKTDRNDARGLADIMRTGWYQEVTVKDIENHKRRTALAVRSQLVGMRTQMINQIRGTLKIYGRILPSGKISDALLADYIEGDDLLCKAVQAMYAALTDITRQITALDREIAKLTRKDARCKLLMTIPGVGEITALAFCSSVGDPGRFDKSRAVGAYFGLTPRRYQSGEVDISGRISKNGDEMVRSYLFEAAGFCYHA